MCWYLSLWNEQVTFFGESLDPETKARSERLVKEASHLLVIGSSLTTYSAYRLLKLFRDEHNSSKAQIGMINIGRSRGDEWVDWKIGSDTDEEEVGCSEVLRMVGLQLLKGGKVTDDEARSLLSSGVRKVVKWLDCFGMWCFDIDGQVWCLWFVCFLIDCIGLWYEWPNQHSHCWHEICQILIEM